MTHSTAELDSELERALDVLAVRAGPSVADRVRAAVDLYLRIAESDRSTDGRQATCPDDGDRRAAAPRQARFSTNASS